MPLYFLSVYENGLVEINTVVLLISIVLVLFAAFYSAKKFKNTNDVNQSIAYYLKFSLIAFVIAFILKFKISLTIGILIAGLIVMLLRSNYYFYK